MHKPFFESLDPQTAGTYSPLALAFVGDAVYEQFIRTKILLMANTSANKLHHRAVHFVKASAQSLAAKTLLPILTETEEAIFKRGRNAHSASVPKNADVTEYRMATGFEALLGYLYLTGQEERLGELMELSFSAIPFE
ncbi:MAG: Mini-ribonuclease 3 [Ruminococcaceae bacterium]|nr:Mini-ribonuclease 3 [Oscillospiraceae bacterium]